MTRLPRIPRDLRQKAKITRAEWTHHCRGFEPRLTGRLAFLVVFLGPASGLGWLAHALGRDITAR